MIIDRKKHSFDNCPTCKGLCLLLVAGYPPSPEYQDWAHRKSCQAMIEFLEAAGHGYQVTQQERIYAYGEAA